MVYCTKCGTENKSGKFCKKCGTELKRGIGRKVIIAIIVLLVVTLAFAQPRNFILKTIGFKFCGDGTCAESELYNCKADCSWCGDGVCQANEGGTCFDDCSWCGDGRCDATETCNSCAHDCGKCQVTSYCGDKICNPGECESGCADCRISECQNGVCEPQKGENCLNAPRDCFCGTSKCNLATGKCEMKTCGNGVCDTGEDQNNCPNDCRQSYERPVDAGSNYPLIFVHGHSIESNQISTTSLMAWVEFQNELADDGLYINEGNILPTESKYNYQAGIWGRLDKPVSIITTYYLGQFSENGFVINEDEKSIEEYSERLAKVIDIVLYATGKSKVNIIAHSMGGLVARQYILTHGTSSVNKLILVATPNHGIYASDITGAFGCSIVHPGIECQEMASNSNFIHTLNQQETYSPIKYLTIAGNSTVSFAGYYSDGFVRVNSVKLQGAQNYVINSSGNIHYKLTSPSLFPSVYKKIVQYLTS